MTPPRARRPRRRDPDTCWTTRLTPAAGSALDPLTEEYSLCALRISGASPTRVSTPEHHLAVAASFDRVVETLFAPGRSVVLTQLRSTGTHATTPELDAVMAFGFTGPAATTPGLVATMARLGRLQLSHPAMPYEIQPCDARAALEPVGEHSAVIRQRVVTIDNSEDEANVLSRFNPTLDPWQRVAEILAVHDAPMAVRATVLATSLSPDDELVLERAAAAASRMQDRAGDHPELAMLTTRAVTTLADLRASLATPPLVVEIAITSDGDLDDVLLQAIGRAFTSEFGVQRRPGGTLVAAQPLLLGSFDVERQPPGLLEALRRGLPLHGGTGPRQLRDLITLSECPIGWPIPVGRPIPGIRATVRRQLPVPGALRDGAPIGFDPSGDRVALPDEARATGLLVTGTTGTGKSTTLFHLARDDVRAGRGFTLVDPHGPLAARVHAELPADASPIVLDPRSPATATLSPFPSAATANRDDVDAGIERFLDAIASVYPEEFSGPRWFDLARAAMALAAAQAAPIPDVLDTVVDQQRLHRTLADVDLPPDQAHVLEGMHHRTMVDREAMLAWFRCKFSPILRGRAGRLLAAPGAGIDLGAAVAASRPVLVDLGALSLTESSMIGHLVISSIIDGLAERRGHPADAGNLYGLYVDEAHRFPGGVNGLTRAIAEGRKWGLGLVLVTQSLTQLGPDMADNAAGIATRLAFRQSPATAAAIGPLLGVQPDDLVSQPAMHGYLRWADHDAVSVQVPTYDEPISAPSRRRSR